MNDDPLVVLALPDGTAAAFPAEAVLAAKERAAQLGFGGSTQPQRRDLDSGTEKLLDSRGLGELLGVDSTTVEAMAKDGRLPSIRIGRLLRFEPAVCIARLRVTDGGRL